VNDFSAGRFARRSFTGGGHRAEINVYLARDSAETVGFCLERFPDPALLVRSQGTVAKFIGANLEPANPG
jgi:hypothetical protein